MEQSTNESRLSSVHWLVEKTGSEIDMDAIIDHERRVQIKELKGVLPTIGCEVEVKWSSLFPEIAREYFGEPDERGVYPLTHTDLSSEKQQLLNAVCQEHDKILKPRYIETEFAGIPSGADAYWEFANKPTFAWETLATEVSLLMHSGLIPEGYEHSLHVTLGGVSPKGGGVCLLLSGLELLYVPAGRIEDAIRPSKYGTNTGWARRGTDGIRQRYAGELLLGQTVASELRTLTISNSEQAANIFRTAQTVGSILLSYRSRDRIQNNKVRHLPPLWEEFRATLYTLWDERKLPRKSWGVPRLQPDDWRIWADSLRNREMSDSLEYHTAEHIRSIVDRAQVIIQEV